MAIKASVVVEQSKHRNNNGQYSYIVAKTKNYTGNTIDQLLTKAEVDKLISDGIEVDIKRS